MFDLFRSRAKAVRCLLGALLVLVALSMVVTLIPGFVGSGYAPDNVIAEIGDEVISTRDVQLSIQQQLRNNAFPREMTGTYVPVIVNRMISDRAVAFAAEQIGFEVTDEDVARSVQSMLPQLFQNGQFVGEQAYAQYLSQMNLTIPEFESNVRKQMLLLRLTNLVLEGEVVTDQEIEEEFRKTNEKIQVDYISIGAPDFSDQVKVTGAEMQEYFDANKTTFQIGEKRDASILVVDEDEISAGIQIADDELKKIYQSSQDQFRTPERVKVRHILLKTTDKTPEEVEQIKAKTEDLLKQIKGGADFAEIARASSEDTGTAVNGGDLDWIGRGQTVSNFENTAFSLKPGEISEVISTEYGFHIIQLQEKEQARLQPFEEVKDQIASANSKQAVYEKMQQLADSAHEQLIANPSNGEQIAQSLGISIYKVEKVAATDPIPEVGSSADMQDSIRSLAENGVSPVYELGTGRLGVAVLTKIHPARPAEFDEVSDTIRDRLSAQKTQEMAEVQKKKLEELAATPDTDLTKIARALGMKVTSSPEFTRVGSVDGIGAAAYMLPAFDKEEGELVGPINAMGRTVICKVVKKVPADLTKLAAERESLFKDLKRKKAAARRELFEDGILTELIESGKVKIFEKNIQRLISVYTS